MYLTMAFFSKSSPDFIDTTGSVGTCPLRAQTNADIFPAVRAPQREEDVAPTLFACGRGVDSFVNALSSRLKYCTVVPISYRFNVFIQFD